MSDDQHPHQQQDPERRAERPERPGQPDRQRRSPDQSPPRHSDHRAPQADRARLAELAHQAMLERGLEPDFPKAALDELARLNHPASPEAGPSPPSPEAAKLRDLRSLLWCSIDNDDSRDLDQLSVGERLSGGAIKVLVSVADVDALVHKGSAIDAHAQRNTTSIYTAGQIFPMLPEKLSTDLTSLGEGEERLSIVMEMVVAEDGSVSASGIYRALVRNQAKLAYNSVGAWLEGTAPEPPKVAAVAGMAEQLRMQNEAAQRLRQQRAAHGALGLATLESRPVFEGDSLTGLEPERRNPAKDLIEDFMIAANGVTAGFLEARRFPSLRRVVRTPKRWPRIVELASQLGEHLPEEPDSAALAAFLQRRREADPQRFPDLSLAVIKLLGSGEYVVDAPGEEAPGHFGLAVKDYTHSTAPNRRYPDLLTHRLLKAALAGLPCPYALAELGALATHCTEKEDDAQKVERQIHKSAAALLLSSRHGEVFDGVITGASEKGTFVRIFHPPVEGMVVHGSHGLDVGDRVRVKLLDTDVDRGFIDFGR